jgi:hypothetical protein
MNPMNVRRALKVSAISVVSLGVTFTAVMGFAHTKAGHPLLALMGSAMGDHSHSGKPGAKCPLGFGSKGTPEEKEASRRQFAASHAGGERAPLRPALGFQLDATTRSDVTAWATAHGISCSVPKSGSDLDCSNVRADALPPGGDASSIGFQSIWFTFGEGDKLIAAVGVRQDPRADEMSSAFVHLVDGVTQEAGSPAKTQGDPSPVALASGALYQASAEYRFRNYFAVARVTNMGSKGYVLTEEYHSLPDS